jgi:hypothetical protein
VTGFTHEFSKVSVPDGAHFESLFLTEDVVGSIVALETKEDCIVSVSAAHSHPRLPDSAGPLNLHRPVGTLTLVNRFRATHRSIRFPAGTN